VDDLKSNEPSSRARIILQTPESRFLNPIYPEILRLLSTFSEVKPQFFPIGHLSLWQCEPLLPTTPKTKPLFILIGHQSLWQCELFPELRFIFNPSASDKDTSHVLKRTPVWLQRPCHVQTDWENVVLMISAIWGTCSLVGFCMNSGMGCFQIL
jgi:hypothetical protein